MCGAICNKRAMVVAITIITTNNIGRGTGRVVVVMRGEGQAPMAGGGIGLSRDETGEAG